MDYHAGDGTQDIFYEDGDTLTVSIHMDPVLDYPSFSGLTEETGKGAGAGANLNLVLPARAAWTHYREALRLAGEAIHKHGAHYLILAFGADTLCTDPDPSEMGRALLEVEDYTSMGEIVRSWALPVLVTQEGGYDTARVGACVHALLCGLSGGGDSAGGEAA